MPLIPEVLDFLQGLFSREQAELAAEFPLGAHTLNALAKALKPRNLEVHQFRSAVHRGKFRCTKDFDFIGINGSSVGCI